MKKLLYPLFLAGICMILAAGCDSENGNEPDQPVTPVDPVNPIDSVDVDSFGIGPFIPYTGPIEPLSNEIRPTLTEGKRWLSVRCAFPYYFDYKLVERHVFYYSTIQGDTIVEGMHAKLMHWQPEKEPIRDFNSPDVIHEIYKEVNNNAVYKYCINMWEGEKGLQFDIDFKVDVSEYEQILGLDIISRGTFTFMGKERRALKVWTHYKKPRPEYDYWVEGIGSLLGHSKGHQLIFTTEKYEKPLLLQCYDGDELIYDYREFKPELYKEIEVFTDIDKQ